MPSVSPVAPVSEPLRKCEQAVRARVSRTLIAFVFALSGVAVAHAQSRFEQDFDDQEKPWQEVAIQLPPAPKPENLLPFYVSETATQTFAIDSKSLTIGSDGVIRYTMVTNSASGVKNISYEGIRCQSFEKKLYAFGREDGTWSRSRRDQWERIVRNAANRQHATLALDYFCQNLTIADNPEKTLERIRVQRPLTQSGY